MNKPINYPLAKLLNEKGFDEPCLGFWFTNPAHKFTPEIWEGSWNNMKSQKDIHSLYYGISAPLYQQAFRWFREKHNLPSEVRFVANLEVYDYRITKIDIKYDNSFYDGVRPTSAFTTYEEAELACLKKLIEICKTNT